jgi:hypothetical protein
MKSHILPAIAAILAFAGAVHASSMDTEFLPVRTETSEGVIVPDRRGSDFYKVVTSADGTRIAELYWTPTAEDVLKTEASLITYLKEARPKASPDLWQKLPQYYRQYVGVGCSCRGNKRIWINFIGKDAAAKDGIDWMARPALIAGGGDRFFNVTYDVQKGTFSDLSINAPI